MWRTAMEELADRFTFVGSHGCDINESLHVRIPATRSRDDGAGVGVAREYHWRAYPLKGSSHGRSVVGERGQWNLYSYDLHSFALKGQDNLVPAGCVSPRRMHQDHSRDCEGCAVRLFLPSMPSSLRPRKSRMAFAIF